MAQTNTSFNKKKQQFPTQPVTPAVPGSEILNLKLNNPPQQNQQQTSTMPTLPPDNRPKVFTDVKTGNKSGIEVGGKTFLGLDPQTVDEMANRNLQNTQVPQGSVSVPQANFERQQQQQLMERQMQGQQLMNQVGQTQQLPIGQTGLGSLNQGEAAGAGVSKIIPGLAGIGTATIGGAMVGGPVGAAAGAALGLVGTFTAGYISNLKEQATAKTAVGKVTLTQGKKSLRVLAQDINQGGNQAIDVELFNQQLALIDQAYGQLKADTNTNLKSFDGAEKELQEYESYYAPGGMREYYINEMQQALLNPNPNKILIDPSDMEVSNE